MALSHAAARGALVIAFRDVIGREPTLREIQFAQAVACVETGGVYDGAAFVNRVTGERVADSHNWGGVQCRALPPCPPDCFEATDRHENGQEYQACFRRYASAADGAKDFIKTLYVGGQQGTKWDRRPLLDYANAGDAAAFAEAMRGTGYFEAGATSYGRAIELWLSRITTALGEPMPVPKVAGGDDGSCSA